MECTGHNLIMRIWTFYHSSSDHACFDHMSRETYAKSQGGIPIRVCAAQRGRDFEAPDLEWGIHFRGVF